MAADFDEPMFDDDFVRSAAFTEPSARERARRAARRAGFAPPKGRRLPWRRGREPSHRTAVLQVVGGVLVLFAISFALWWFTSGSKDEEPVRPVVPTITRTPAPTPSGGVPTAIPEV